MCSCPFIFLPFACMFLSCCINFLPFPSCPFISFLKLWNSLYGLARGPSATKVITKLSLRLSLNNQPLQHMTLDIFRRKFATNRWRERERKKKRERETETQRARGHHSLNFPHRFCPFCECAQQYLLGLRQV